MRQLVTVRTVGELIPIEGADQIELARVDGWQCVVKKDSFRVGDLGLFFEIDSVLPDDDERWSFLEPRKFRVRTMKLRGALSQGLLMPMLTMTDEEAHRWRLAAEMQDAETLTDILRVQKYEPPAPMGGQHKGSFPTHLVPKSDQERIQNIPGVLEGRTASEFEITEKLDGTSCTFYYFARKGVVVPQDGAQLHGERNPQWGACSRNWEMKLYDDENMYAKLWCDLGLHTKLATLGRNLAIQGEIIGPKIQSNRYKRAAQEFYVFDIYDIDLRRYLWPVERIKVADQLDLLHVPILTHILMSTKLDMAEPEFTLESVLAAAEGQSALNTSLTRRRPDFSTTQREGIVFKHHGRVDGTQAPLSFKVISNKFLLKNE